MGPNDHRCGISALLILGARVAMSLFGRWSELAQFQTVRAVRTHFGVGDDHWACFTRTVGDFQDDLRVLAAFPERGCWQGFHSHSFPMAQV